VVAGGFVLIFRYHRLYSKLMGPWEEAWVIAKAASLGSFSLAFELLLSRLLVLR